MKYHIATVKLEFGGISTMNNEPDYKDNLYFERTNKMTQKIFDVENEKDMQDLWDILPDKVYLMARGICDSDIRFWYNTKGGKTSSDCYLCDFLKINWHDKKEIERPIQEATEKDVGKLCYFWDNDGSRAYGLLSDLIIEEREDVKYGCVYGKRWTHAKRLTKQEIEELI